MKIDLRESGSRAAVRARRIVIANTIGRQTMWIWMLAVVIWTAIFRTLLG